MKNIFKLLACSILLFSGIAAADEPTLTIATKTGKKTFTVSELLKRNDTETVVVENDPVYPGVVVQRKFTPMHARQLTGRCLCEPASSERRCFKRPT
jgi:hypothetical protein